MGVYTNIPIQRKAKIYEVTKDTVKMRITRYTMNDMIGAHFIQPFATINSIISGFWRWKERKIRHHLTRFFHDITAILFYICKDN